MLVHRVADSLLDLIFPPRCASCGAGGAVLCAACLGAARTPAAPLCARCGDSLSAVRARVGAPSDQLCSACAAGLGPRHLAAARAAAVYDGPIRLAVLALKFRGQRRLAEPLGGLLADEVRRACWSPEVVVPVPLHDMRRRSRGYNQAELLARACARRLSVSCLPDTLIRTRATRPQVGLSAEERRANVAGAFTLAGSGPARTLADRCVLLVDDVYTTGSTLDAAARALGEAAPAAVLAVALTRPALHADNADAGARSVAAPRNWRASR